MDDPQRIPLSSVAPDARGSIQMFRDNGEISFQDVPLEQARENYLRACAAYGLPRLDLPLVRDHSLPSRDGALRVREYRSGAQGKAPAILFLHGGGWVIGDLETHDGLCRLLAKESQATVFAVDYRLAPEHPFPGPLDDCIAALQWLSSNADALGVDLSRLGLAGDSAGGNLAAVLANEDRLRPEGCSPRAQALFYPVTDLRCKTSSYRRIVSGFPLTAASMRWFRDHYVGSEGAFDDPRLSPLLAPRLSRAPLFLLSCGLDPLADEGVAYAARAIEGGGRVEHHHLPAHAHGILTSAGRIETGRTMALRAAQFLRETLHQSTGE
jgi:acetyl esterase